ncbi:hypothetical protein EC845_3758 [Comamonas sp. BIGb0124]|uniref:DUF6172 family protein n=1 Tax=Comamonas sp. BIGb0124 TaxID=2485130 RepID=UPI000F465D02|nr:DUF6172 family protein [Comamonas sp. BIGb0124]ROR17953.1 hypothetical protein EC845_3758 [Comamonas sp. BIGb0124]
MKKTFLLHAEGKNPDRVFEAVKHDIRKYIQRERNKALPKGADYWDFDCRFGADEAHAEAIHLSAITECVNAARAEGRQQFYLEILARPANRQPRAETGPADADEADSAPD